ncbi:hypothetical protein [Methylobacter sp. Wu1]
MDVASKADSASMARPLETHPDDKQEHSVVLCKGIVVTVDSNFVIIILP